MVGIVGMVDIYGLSFYMNFSESQHKFHKTDMRQHLKGLAYDVIGTAVPMLQGARPYDGPRPECLIGRLSSLAGLLGRTISAARQAG
jgi:hypothetical protein